MECGVVNAPAARGEEFAVKLARLRARMIDEGLDACLLALQANHAWLACGADTHIVIASTDGAGQLVVTRDRVVLVADNIELGRLMDEEFHGLPLETATYPWSEGGARAREIIGELIGNTALGADVPFPGARDIGALLTDCRASLLPAEVERYARLGAEAEEAMRSVCTALQPGVTEFQIAAALGESMLERGMIPNLILVACDERISRYRHPIPTDKRLERVAMLVICARRHGLIANLTRMVCFGTPSDELRRKHLAVCNVDAELILSTVPGAGYGEIFQRGLAVYRETGFADEWRLHHQGGPTGYAGREFKATEESAHVVVDNQAVAWNPSITGTKVEDTFIAAAAGPRIVTAAREWPMLRVQRPAGALERPDILVL